MRQRYDHDREQQDRSIHCVSMCKYSAFLKQATAKQQKGCWEQALSSSLPGIFWISSACYSPLSREVVAGFPIKLIQVSPSTAKSTFEEVTCETSAAISEEWLDTIQLQWVPESSQGFYVLPPYKLINVMRHKFYNQLGIKIMNLHYSSHGIFPSSAVMFDSSRLPRVLRTYKNLSFPKFGRNSEDHLRWNLLFFTEKKESIVVFT